ncbi:UNVERIFIED_CONTAM: hypothetical protein GTU68_066290 [Idotea baltica]|nr:hypothetical protein [Idotea baltica]
MPLLLILMRVIRSLL